MTTMAEPDSDQRADSGMRVLVWIVGLFALAGALVYSPRLYRAVQIARWATTTATIVDQQVRNEFAGLRIRSTIYPKRYEDRLRVRYSYVVAGATYSAAMIGPDVAYVRDAPHRESQYAVGTRLPARYDPSRPSNAELEPPSVTATLLSWLVCVVAGLWALARGRPSRWR